MLLHFEGDGKLVKDRSRVSNPGTTPQEGHPNSKRPGPVACRVTCAWPRPPVAFPSWADPDAHQDELAFVLNLVGGEQDVFGDRSPPGVGHLGLPAVVLPRSIRSLPDDPV